MLKIILESDGKRVQSHIQGMRNFDFGYIVD